MDSRRTKRDKRNKKKSVLTLLNWGLFVVYSVSAVFLAYSIYRYKIFNFRNLNHFLVGAMAVLGVVGVSLLLRKKAKKWTTVLLIIGIALSGFGIWGVQSLVQLGSTVNKNASYSSYDMEIIVPADSTISDVSQVTSLLAPVDNDGDNITKLLDSLQSEKNVTLTPTPTASYMDAYQAMMAGQGDAMVLNSVFLEMLRAEDPEVDSKIKVLYSMTNEIKNESSSTNQETGNAINIYISGIDTFGSISSVSRSDVNIIMTINRDTKKILLTTTPRDAYVTIPGAGQNQKDKLTHAGIYGVDTSVQTLEQLYGIDIHYYARLNFTSFLKLIDVVGGVDVENTQEFTSLYGKYYFPVGQVHLDSDQALGFVRERYSLANGDNDRGKNQEKVIAALINKLTQPENLLHYQEIMHSLSDSIQTDMQLETMMELVNQQLETGGNFTVTSQAVSGTGSTGVLPSYAMPGYALYMMELNPDSLEQAKAAINATLAGQ
ncbi:LytR family transcriptional regulator [Streptococcus suis]|nr:LytR family transcriptional regulator [Streptococcus suis]